MSIDNSVNIKIKMYYIYEIHIHNTHIFELIIKLLNFTNIYIQ